MADRKVLQRIYLLQLTNNFIDSGPMPIISGKYKKVKCPKGVWLFCGADYIIPQSDIERDEHAVIPKFYFQALKNVLTFSISKNNNKGTVWTDTWCLSEVLKQLHQSFLWNWECRIPSTGTEVLGRSPSTSAACLGHLSKSVQVFDRREQFSDFKELFVEKIK